LAKKKDETGSNRRHEDLTAAAGKGMGNELEEGSLVGIDLVKSEPQCRGIARVS
jgi:hypothetical protein